MRCLSALSSGLTSPTPPPPVIRPPNAAADHQFVGAQLICFALRRVSLLFRATACAVCLSFEHLSVLVPWHSTPCLPNHHKSRQICACISFVFCLFRCRVVNMKDGQWQQNELRPGRTRPPEQHKMADRSTDKFSTPCEGRNGRRVRSDFWVDDGSKSWAPSEPTVGRDGTGEMSQSISIRRGEAVQKHTHTHSRHLSGMSVDERLCAQPVTQLSCTDLRRRSNRRSTVWRRQLCIGDAGQMTKYLLCKLSAWCMRSVCVCVFVCGGINCHAGRCDDAGRPKVLHHIATNHASFGWCAECGIVQSRRKHQSKWLRLTASPNNCFLPVVQKHAKITEGGLVFKLKFRWQNVFHWIDVGLQSRDGCNSC